MIRNRTRTATLVMILVPSAIFLVSVATSRAQTGVTVAADVFPYSRLAEPRNAFEEDLQIQIDALRVEIGAPPMVLGGGRTLLQNSFSYDLLQIDYRNWSAIGGSRVDEAHGLEYTAMLQRQLSETWMGLAFVSPGLYSDFKGELTGDDFNLSGAIAVMKQHSETLSYGFGAAYTLRFGEPFPVPLVALNWTASTSMRFDILLPARADFWYAPTAWVELGLGARVSGGQYHGDPEFFDGANPQMRYSSATVGPTAVFHFGQFVHLRIDAGTTMLRRFEFFDGDEEQRSLDLEGSEFVRLGLTFGG